MFASLAVLHLLDHGPLRGPDPRARNHLDRTECNEPMGRGHLGLLRRLANADAVGSSANLLPQPGALLSWPRLHHFLLLLSWNEREPPAIFDGGVWPALRIIRHQWRLCRPGAAHSGFSDEHAIWRRLPAGLN